MYVTRGKNKLIVYTLTASVFVLKGMCNQLYNTVTTSKKKIHSKTIVLPTYNKFIVFIDVE